MTKSELKSAQKPVQVIRLRVSDEEIMRATRHCIDAEGPDGFTMAEVAREAGLTRVQIYNRFGSRDALVLALMIYHAEKFNTRVAAKLARAPTVAAAIVIGMMEAIKAAERDQYFGQLVGPANSSKGGIPGAPEASLETSRRLWVPVIHRGIATGELNSIMAPEKVAEWIALTELSLFNAVTAFKFSHADCEHYISVFVVRPLLADPDSPVDSHSSAKAQSRKSRSKKN